MEELAARAKEEGLGAVFITPGEIQQFLREILMDEQDHLIALATALGIDPPDAGIAD